MTSSRSRARANASPSPLIAGLTCPTSLKFNLRIVVEALHPLLEQRQHRLQLCRITAPLSEPFGVQAAHQLRGAGCQYRALFGTQGEIPHRRNPFEIEVCTNTLDRKS